MNLKHFNRWKRLLIVNRLIMFWQKKKKKKSTSVKMENGNFNKLMSYNFNYFEINLYQNNCKMFYFFLNILICTSCIK